MLLAQKRRFQFHSVSEESHNALPSPARIVGMSAAEPKQWHVNERFVHVCTMKNQMQAYSEAPEFSHHIVQSTFIVFQQHAKLSILILQCLILEDKRSIEAFQLGFELLCMFRTTESASPHRASYLQIDVGR